MKMPLKSFKIEEVCISPNHWQRIPLPSTAAAVRLELTAVVFIHVYELVAWGDPTAGNTIDTRLTYSMFL